MNKSTIYWAWALLALLQVATAYGWFHLELGLGPFASAGMSLFAIWPVVGTLIGSIGATSVLGMTNTMAFLLFFGGLAAVTVASRVVKDRDG